MDGSRNSARLPLNVLVLYDQGRPLAADEHERLVGLADHTRHKVYYTPATQRARLHFSLELFDAVILDGSVRPGELAADFAAALPRYAGPKVMLRPDGHVGAAEWSARLGIDLVFTSAATAKNGAHVDLGRAEIAALPSASADLARAVERALERRGVAAGGRRFLARLVGAPTGLGTIAPLEPATVFSLPVPIHTLPPLSAAPAPDVPGLCQGRLTLMSGSPLVQEDCWSDILYFTPCDGNRVALFGPEGWTVHSFYELALSLGKDVRGRTNHDVFLTQAGARGPLRLVVEPWADDARRLRELTQHDGVWVQADAPQRRFLGTFRTSVTGIAEDSHGKRFLWNLYQPQEKHLLASEMTCHEYAGGPRLWNSDASFHCALVLGLPQRVGFWLSAFLRTNRSGEPACVHAALDGCLDPYSEWGGRVENATPQFLGVASSGGALLPAGSHTLGAAEQAGPGGGLFANAWLRGSVRC